jgi:hypothetical protein
MTDTAKPAPFAPRSILIAAAILGALAFSTQSGTLLRPHLVADWIAAVPYLRSAIIASADIVLMIALAAIAATRTPAQILALTGLGAPVLKPLLWGVAVFAPAVAIAGLSAPLAPVDGGFWWLAIGAPFVEELGYRGLAIGVLMRLSGWSFWPACLAPAAFFGAAHFWNGDDLASIAGIIAITGLGGVFFGWLFVRWGFNLWPPIIAHAGLNAMWGVFALGENAIGGWLGNALRLGVVALAIALTIVMTRRRNELKA